MFLDQTKKTLNDINEFVKSLQRESFQGSRYDKISHNCMKFAQSLTLFLVNKETPSEFNECSSGYCVADFFDSVFLRHWLQSDYFYHRDHEFAFLFKSNSEIANGLMQDLSLYQTFRRILREYQENAYSAAGELTVECIHSLHLTREGQT